MALDKEGIPKEVESQPGKITGVEQVAQSEVSNATLVARSVTGQVSSEMATQSDLSKSIVDQMSTLLSTIYQS